MLIEDGRRRLLVAAPGRATGAVRLYRGFGVGSLVVAGLALVAAVGAGVGWLTGPGARVAGDLRTPWPAVGFAVAALFFAGLAGWFGAGVRRVRRFAAHDFLVGLDEVGILVPDQGRIPYDALSEVVVTRRAVPHPRTRDLGSRAGVAVAAWLTTRAGQDDRFRQLTLQVSGQRPVHCYAPVLATDHDFGCFLAALGEQLDRRGVPIRLVGS